MRQAGHSPVQVLWVAQHAGRLRTALPHILDTVSWIVQPGGRFAFSDMLVVQCVIIIVRLSCMIVHVPTFWARSPMHSWLVVVCLFLLWGGGSWLCGLAAYLLLLQAMVCYQSLWP
jgi:hypothetical protein